jgi:hypothetical protein
MRFLSVALVCATLATSLPAQAFVVPRWNVARERRSALIGTWRAVTYKKQYNVSVLDPGITISFERAVMWVEHSGKTEKGTWKIVTQDGDLLGVEVTDDKGKMHSLDVLVEGADALTLYIEDDSGDDEETLRLERVR